MISQDKTAAAGQQHAHPVTVDIERRTKPKFIVREIFPSVGVNHDVLGSGKKSDQKGGPCNQPGIGCRVGHAQTCYCQRQKYLKKQ